ncbi:MAG: hypothetical protein AVDCRST_MAG01-01-4137, partial [uncultured Rubrobacteraceae bacterium]
ERDEPGAVQGGDAFGQADVAELGDAQGQFA